METKELLNRAWQEIVTLRRDNEVLRARVEMIDLFACVLHTQPSRQFSGMMQPDIAHELRVELDRLKASS